jgi:hypothetical protein
MSCGFIGDPNLTTGGVTSDGMNAVSLNIGNLSTGQYQIRDGCQFGGSGVLLIHAIYQPVTIYWNHPDFYNMPCAGESYFTPDVFSLFFIATIQHHLDSVQTKLSVMVPPVIADIIEDIGNVYSRKLRVGRHLLIVICLTIHYHGIIQSIH